MQCTSSMQQQQYARMTAEPRKKARPKMYKKNINHPWCDSQHETGSSQA